MSSLFINRKYDLIFVVYLKNEKDYVLPYNLFTRIFKTKILMF